MAMGLVATQAFAAPLTRNSTGFSGASPGGSAASSSAAAQTSQTATAATLQTTQAAAASTRAADSMKRMNSALQVLQSQMAAQSAANLKALNNLGSMTNPKTDPKTGQAIINVIDGVGTGGLDPLGGAIVDPTHTGIQNIQLQGTGSGISLANGGQVSLVAGTGSGQIQASGAGSITTTGGTITATSGGLSTSTTTGGTLTTTNGGTVVTTGANETISTSLPTTVTISGSGGTITALDGTTTTFTAPTTPASYALPAGSTVKLSSAGQVAVTGATTLSLSGAGSLTTTAGGTVSNTGGTTTFGSAVAATLPGGSAIDFSGNSSLTLASGSSGFSINVPANVTLTTVGSASISNTTAYTLPASWANVGSLTDSKPTAPTSGGFGDLVTVVQTGQQALLQWNTFNVGAHTELEFDQSAGGANVGEWVAINKVVANIAPSWILGSIQAPGQVYVINQNGIIFTGTSQVNTHALVASSLPINDNLVNTGLLNNSSDLSYLFSSLQSSTTGAGLFTPPLSTSAAPASPTTIGGTAPDGGTVVNVATGGVIVEAGAQIQSPTTPEHVGGRVALIGPSVENDGTIFTPDGQTIFAAGFQVGLLPHASTDPSLRGLDVYLGAATDPTGAYNSNALIQGGLFPTVGIASNGIAINDPAAVGVPPTTLTYGLTGAPMLGLIEAPRADVSLAGANIQQNSFLDSSTSVALNGRVDMTSAFDEIAYLTFSPATNTNIVAVLPSSTGNLTFGLGSITQILPEQTTDTVVGSQLALSSSINLKALNIDLNQGAMILAPDANISLLTGTYGRDSVGIVPVFSSDEGTITAEQGSAIDASGSADVSASVAENIVAVQLRGTELANSPVQQNGALRGQTVDVDMSQYGTYNGGNWIGSPIGDLSGYAALIQHTAQELTVNGGTISLTAGTSVNLNPGATLDVSGGYINYAGALVQTSKVVSGNQILDISQATPDRVYSGVLKDVTITSQKWGVTQTDANAALAPQYSPGYIQGGNGGTLSITAPSVTLNGVVSGNTIAGVRQRQLPNTLPTTFGSTSGLSIIQSIYGAPQSSALQIDFSNQQLVSGAPTRIPGSNLKVNFRPGVVTNSNPSANEFDLSTDLVNLDGFSNLKLMNDFGAITVPADAPLNMMPGGSLSFYAASVDVLADISSPGGNLNLSAAGELTLNGNLNVSGLIVDSASNGAVGADLPLFITGGNVILQSSNLNLNSGSSIHVSGGLYVSPANKQTYGAAGAITLNAAVDLVNAQNSEAPEQNQFVQGAELEGYSGLRTGAGQLNIQAPLVQIGGTSLINGGTSQNSLLLPDSFFNQGGFGTFSITGVGDSTDAQRASVLVAPGTVIKKPKVQSWVAEVSGSQYVLMPTTLPLQSLRSPVSISLNAPGVADPGTGLLRVQGNVVIGQGAIISLGNDPSNSVRLFGGNLGTVVVLGQILVPGGTISIEADGNTGSIFNGGNPVDAPLTTVDLGPAGILNASGTTEATANLYGLTTGTVLDGGKISVTGNILAEAGSQILVNGASATLAVSSGYSSQARNVAASAAASYVNVPVFSNGGSIVLTGKEELFTEAALSGRAGGTSAQGGSLTVSSGSFFSLNDINNLGASKPIFPNDASLVFTNSGTTYDASSLNSSSITGAIGMQVPTTGPLVVDAHGKNIYGYFSTQEFAGTGLSSLTLSGNLEIATAGGNISLAAARGISVASQGVILLDDPTRNITVSLTAPYVAMGTYYNPAQQQSQQQTTFDSNGNPIAPHIFTDPTSGNVLGLAPLPGNGTLDVNAATLVEVGSLSLQGFSTLNINQSGLPAGDVRGTGTLELQGNINIQAGQIYPATESTFTIAAYSGSINISGTGQLPLLPLSAGGTLNLYASTINQDGVLRAPMGVINLGAASNTLDILSQSNFDQASTIELGSSSVTSVSLVDPTTGQTLIVPYGTNQNGTNWIDPAGNDITLASNGALGIPIKQVFVVGNQVTDNAGATIDIQGGGDLYSARWVTGTGGTKDILNADNTKGSFSVIPGYGANYSPLDPTPGYSATNLQVGDRVYLSGGSGLAAGFYTLLPAQYALLPGAYLVTRQSTAPVLAGSVPAVSQTDGAALVTGYKFNGLAVGGGSSSSAPSLYSTFEVAPGTVVRARAEYDSFSANTFLAQSAISGNKAVPRLPVDAGQLVFNATSRLSLQGSDTIETSAALGQGGLVDISSSSTIDILDSGTAANALGLLTSQLNGLNAASLLIGGTRGTDGETVTVATSDLEVNDHGQVLTGQDLVLVSNGTLNIDAGSVISTPASDSSITPGSLIVEGSGALIRVSSGQNGKVTRVNINANNNQASLNIAGARITAEGSTPANPLSVGTLILDSTGQFQLDAGASLPSVLSGDTLTFNAGQISILFPKSGAPTPSNGLVLTQAQIQALQQSVKNLNFLSYSSIDLYGAGSLGTDALGNTVLDGLSFEASQLRGYYFPSSLLNTGVTLSALKSVSFQNGTALQLAPVGANPVTSQLEASLSINAPVVELGGGTGNNSFAINGFQNTSITAGKEILVLGTAAVNQSTSTALPQATFNVVDGSLQLNAPLITGNTGSYLEVLAGSDSSSAYHDIQITSNGSPDPTLVQGLDGVLVIKGANITDSSAIIMPSGQVTLEAASGGLTVSGSIDVSGAAPIFNGNVVEYTNGGTVTLKADNGNLNLTGGTINVSAQSGVGTTAANAGAVTLQASGSLLADNTTTLLGHGGIVTGTAAGPVISQGQNGSFSLDVAGTNLTAEPGGPGMASDLGVLASILSPVLGDFIQAQSIRIRSGDVQIGAATVVTANSFNLSADTGNVDVYGTINASGVTGGQVALDASGNVTLHGGSLVTVAGRHFADSGSGGSVSLQGGAYNGSVNSSAEVTIASGATVDLSVTAPVALGDATGTLKITVPSANFNTTGIVVQGNILSPSSILLEGNKVYGNTNPAVIGSVVIDGFESQIGSDAANNVTAWTPLVSTILGNNSNLAGLTIAGFGAEIVNAGGDLVLNSTWDFSSLSSTGIIGDLSLRASGNIILKGGTFGTSSSTLGASLTDGFSSNPTAPWEATLLSTPSWSFNLTAGADLSAADSQQVIGGQGSLLVGYGGPSKTVDQASEGSSHLQGTTASTQNIFTAYYQTIRTGTGDINISTGKDVQLLNALVNIYTAGRQLSPGQTASVLSPNDFDPPQLTIPGTTSATKTTLGNRPNPSPYVAQYSWGGGNVTILADGNIEHVTQNGSPDSSREMPTSWLDRRGFTLNGVFADNRLNPATGLPYTGLNVVLPGGIASTSWWVDFSNFSEGVGALGGGNVTLIAGGSVTNVDASIPTNARMAGKNSSGAGIAPNTGNLVELGGGDLVVRAGDNIDGGVYYVERGTGTLDAGYKVTTNSSRATLPATSFGSTPSTANSQNWLPTTLFVGAASFDVSAGNDLELGSVVNPFLLPQNISNSFLLKTYFSTYATSDVVNVESLTGNVTMEGSTSSNTGTIGGWYNNVLGFQSGGSQSWSFFQPWLALAETKPSLFTTATSLLPPTLQVVAFSENSRGTSGDITLVGNLTLSPSPTGNLDLVAADSISGLSYNSAVNASQYTTINLSDANPAGIAGVASPISLSGLITSASGISWASTPPVSQVDLFAPLKILFAETGSTTGLLQTKEALHASIIGSNGIAEPLHYGDSTPVHIDAGTGDISGFTFYSAKFADIAAGQDITDIGLYIQNTSSSDISVVAAGRDLIAWDANSALRLGLESTYNLTSNQLASPQTGDIQISGPGTIEVLAGQNFDLGVSTGTSSTGLGLTSIGDGRNPVLPFGGADIIAAAGVGNPAGLDVPSSNLHFLTFISDFLTPGSTRGDRYLPDLGALLGLDNASVFAIRNAFNLLPLNQQDAYALTIFYDVLRDAGRDHNSGSQTGGFTTGYDAIKALFPAIPGVGPNTLAGKPYPGGFFSNPWPYLGDISLTSREIKTTNGGDISILVPGGQLTVGLPINGAQTLEQGIFTVDGGNISIFANNNVNVGVSRIFTLNGGNEIIWSSLGNIAAGASSKTVQSAPPTRVIIDPQSGNVQTDLAGLATGGGIGVLQTVAGATASNVDLIAPTGFIDAGDAGIRASGNINVAAQEILNAGNITSGGSSTGVPATAAPNLAGLSAASSASGSATQAGLNNTPGRTLAQQTQTDLPSIITVEVLGYGGGDSD